MDKRFLEHGSDADVKASRPENKGTQGSSHLKTKLDMPANKQEGVADEPSHSGHRQDGRNA